MHPTISISLMVLSGCHGEGPYVVRVPAAQRQAAAEYLDSSTALGQSEAATTFGVTLTDVEVAALVRLGATVERDTVSCQRVIALTAPTADPETTGKPPEACTDGTTPDVWLLDSGLDLREFNYLPEGSAFTKTCPPNRACHPHGTHMATILTADGTCAVLHSFTVLDANNEDEVCESVSSVLMGLEQMKLWKKKKENRDASTVALMSLATKNRDPLVDDAVNDLASLGVVFVVSAGNEGEPAAGRSPTAVASAIVVGGADPYGGGWTAAAGSGTGSAVDLYAEWIPKDCGMAGTSCSAAVVARLAVQYLQYHPSARPEQVAVDLERVSIPMKCVEGRCVNAATGVCTPEDCIDTHGANTQFAVKAQNRQTWDAPEPCPTER